MEKKKYSWPGSRTSVSTTCLFMLLASKCKMPSISVQIRVGFILNLSDSTSAKPLKAPEEEEMQEATGSVAHAKEINMDAAMD